MKIERFVLGDFEVNSYLIINNKEAVLIDVGFEPDVITEYIMTNNLELKAILLTHAHLDHIGGLEEIRERFNVDVYIHRNEAEWLVNPSFNGSKDFPFFGEVMCKPTNNLLTDNDELLFGDTKIKVIHTPGHTPGGVSYLINRWLFTGDTLFNNSIGRTDLWGGNYKQLIDSIKNKIFKLSNEVIVYPGHGEKTSIKNEKVTNPFIQIL